LKIFQGRPARRLSAAGGCATIVASAMLAWTVVAGTVPATAAATATAAASAAPQLHVAGNRLVNQHGARVILRGVNRSGGEFMCVHNAGIWDGPMNQASVTAMKRWHVNAVRIPLNEACWNGQSYVNQRYRGATYRRAVEAYVRLLNANGLAAILVLAWSDGKYSGPSAGCTSPRAICQKPMPDAAEAVPFWTSVARAFKGNNSVLFDLFNEAYPERATGGSESEGWSCWLRGGSACKGISFAVAGMQRLVSAVRSVGARNVIMLGGLEYANDLTQWLTHEPADPDHNLVASWHSYSFNACRTASCWSGPVARVIARVPVLAGEIGETNCADTYLRPLMAWLDRKSTGYLAWAWNADFRCGAGPSLISNYGGTPTAYGRGYRAHLLSFR
jgi:endoglucanase